ncbi:hypothetical protein ACFL3I_03270 [Pseudomonadota bacterium]
MFDFPRLDKLAYTIESGADLFDMPEQTLSELVHKHRLRTFRVKRKRYIPTFEMDRLVSLLLQEQVARDMEQSHG